ncbi:hypothetical protein [Streptomyces sp. NBC_00344]|uniref:hypothetical protein n=1 Tax=Streptomyces sp. NBC_00344 TaxID=2975720 RepID=UPI002E20CA10
MRLSQDPTSSRSATPIYDALCSEYRRSFRTLPGDRSNEENNGFTPFGIGPHGSGLHGTGPQSGQHGSGQHSSGHRPPENLGFWQRQPTGNHVPAALPPGPRRGT